ncbi:MAG: Hsp20/alpha crystallin family protein [Candidatus Methylomirabilota bacterium]
MMLTKWQPRLPSLVRWDPFEETAGFRRFFDQPFEALLHPGVTSELTFRPLADVSESKDGFTVTVELPGMKQEDIVVSVEENVLSVKGERKRETETAEEGYSRIERVHGSFERQFAFPATADMERIHAAYRDGVLEIRLPKKEEAKPKTVKIETA